MQMSKAMKRYREIEDLELSYPQGASAGAIHQFRETPYHQATLGPEGDMKLKFEIHHELNKAWDKLSDEEKGVAVKTVQKRNPLGLSASEWKRRYESGEEAHLYDEWHTRYKKYLYE